MKVINFINIVKKLPGVVIKQESDYFDNSIEYDVVKCLDYELWLNSDGKMNDILLISIILPGLSEINFKHSHPCYLISKYTDYGYLNNEYDFDGNFESLGTLEVQYLIKLFEYLSKYYSDNHNKVPQKLHQISFKYDVNDNICVFENEKQIPNIPLENFCEITSYKLTDDFCKLLQDINCDCCFIYEYSNFSEFEEERKDDIIEDNSEGELIWNNLVKYINHLESIGEEYKIYLMDCD